MQHKVQSASEVSRQTLQKLVTLWLAIMFLTFATAFLLSINTARADILKVFTTSPTIIQEQGQPHLHPQTQGIVQSNFSGRDQRNAENLGV